MRPSLLTLSLLLLTGCRAKNLQGIVRLDGGALAGAHVTAHAATGEWLPPDCGDGLYSSWTSTNGSHGMVMTRCASAREELDRLLAAGKVAAPVLASATSNARGEFKLDLPPGKYDLFAESSAGSGFALDCEPLGAPIDLSVTNAIIDGWFFNTDRSDPDGTATLTVIFPRPAIVWTQQVDLATRFAISGVPRREEIYVWVQAPGWASMGERPGTHHGLSLGLKKLHALRGRVEYAGLPVPGAKVQSTDDRQEALTGPDGRFAFARTDCVTCILLVTHGDLLAKEYGVSREGEDLDVTVTLAEPSSFEVRVVDELSRLPLADATLWVTGAGVPDPEVLAQDAGLFFVRRAVPGLYDYRAEAAGHLAGDDRWKVHGPAPQLLALKRAHALHGVVLRPDGGTLEGATVTCHSELAITGPDGAFHLDKLPPGEGQVEVKHPDYPPASEPLTLPRANPLIITLREGGLVVVRVIDAAGRPVHGAHVEPFNEAGEQDMELHLIGHQETDPSGEQRMGPLRPGRYSLHARSGDAHSKSAAVEVVAGKTLRLELRLRRE